MQKLRQRFIHAKLPNPKSDQADMPPGRRERPVAFDFYALPLRGQESGSAMKPRDDEKDLGRTSQLP